MLTEEELNLLADIFADRFGNVNARILLDMAETLKDTEDLIPAYSKKLQQMYTFGYDVDLITQQLARESGKSIEEIEKLYEAVAQEGYDWAKPFYEAKEIKQIPLAENKVLQNIIQSAAAVTKESLRNISNTTTVGIRTEKGFEPLGSFYKKTVDQAIASVATGTEDYKKVIRQAVKDMGSSGLRVKYESGYTKRLDSAIRQNILDGVSYIAQETARATGKEFGSDGVEISAHSPCAPDHIPYQGNQYSNEEFEKLQSELKRPIGEWNCRHIAYAILLGISSPANSKSELKEMKRYSNEKITIDGNEYTRYECTQLQRKIETNLRYAREEKLLYQAIEDKDLVRGATEKIRLLSNKYVEVSEKAGLPTKVERTKIVSTKIKEKTGMKPK
ncbi:phage minor capsid protein [Anaerotignum sp. MB30-C6]|uniref:phage minor capsid protein n=1 Tax=Anaerotignum sp. MB30-C6 TaxID=3070814 RepID=UPI0027DAFBEB|nr:phage minor capsid protein [Anaerotignum sp. MB30-C6]WMI81937.1 phage minor capsid protein [Anaerotignum sp. MB30-C6]